MALHQGEEFRGIVVSRKNYRERDMLVKILTDRFGFKTFFVRGVAKRGFSMGAAILPYAYGTYLGSISDEGLSFITNPKEVEQFRQLSQDIELNAYAAYILGLAEQAFMGQYNPSWYLNVYQALSLIDQGFDPAVITNIMEVQFLACFGVMPNLRTCVICQQATGSFDYSESYGGLLCEKHWYLDPHRLHLDQRTIYFLRLFSAVDLSKINSIELEAKTKVNLRKTLDEIYRQQVGVYVKAKRFLDQMAKWHL